MQFPWSKPKWDPKGKHCYVAGGSSGLGLSLALLLASRGAHVSVVARDPAKLATALAALESARVAEDQQFHMHSHSLYDAAGSRAALADVCAPFGGRAPDATFLVAATWAPKYWMELSEEELVQGMDGAYWVQAWTAWVVSRQMAQQKRTGKIVFVSSTAGYMSIVGWASYGAAKHGLRGLADGLHSELMLYGIDVHLYSPGKMFTPGYDKEAQTKPSITAKIEESDPGITPDVAARGMLKGIENGQAHITTDLITSIFRSGSRGAAWGNNWLVDGLLDFAGRIAIPIWRASVDKQVLQSRAEHEQYLHAKGFFEGEYALRD